MRSAFFLYLCSLFLSTNINYCQKLDSLKTRYNQGISISGGITYCAIKDGFISSEKYSGTATNFSFHWLKEHETYLYDLKMEILTSSNIRNNSVSANVTDFNLSMAYCYPISNINFLGTKMNLFFGPYPELYLHYRFQNIARGGEALFDAYSFAFLFSLGGKLLAYIPISTNLFLSGDFSSNLIALGGKFVNPRDKEIKMVKLLTAFEGVRFSSQYSIAYKPASTITVSAGYRISLARITAWDSFLFVADNFFLSLTYNL
jgi:hypothetical protein